MLNAQQRQAFVQQLQQLEASLDSTDTLSSPAQHRKAQASGPATSAVPGGAPAGNGALQGPQGALEESRQGGDSQGAPQEAPQRAPLGAPKRVSGGPTVSGALMKALGVKTQMFLPDHFLGDAERICNDFKMERRQEERREKGEKSEGPLCAPSLETVLQLLLLRLQRWWGRDMLAFLSLMSPYLELEHFVPLDPTCRPPEEYWVVPLTQQQWAARQQQRLQQQQQQQQQQKEGVQGGKEPIGQGSFSAAAAGQG
ncbi:hypothetical protein EBH_0084070 [Eimeria brunetti]|uniref:Uncharacterized protein n=1 Tax=Eimeria brunetti TaxID=51314 RepID=U6LVM3_9EIME|nr:hypothetical protein EBH_0084070 [Eimeria brunetti]